MQCKISFRSLMFDPAAAASFKLAVVWLIGLAFGAYVGFEAAPALCARFRIVLTKEITVFGTLLVMMIPLLASVSVVQLFSSNAILVVVFLKAAAFSLVGVACAFSWGSAGWLVSRLLLFSDILCIPVYLWIWHRILFGCFNKTEVIASVLVISVICLADCYFISPFLCSVV